MEGHPPAYTTPGHHHPQTMNYPHMATAPPNNIPMHVAAPAFTPTVNYGPSSQNAMCPTCHKTCLTKVKTKATSKTHLWAFCLFCFTGCLCCIPYFMKSCLDTNHYCSSCNNFLGTYHS